MSLEFPSKSPESYEKVPLLREAVEVLINELAAISEHLADELPELKKRKVVLASRLGTVDWSPAYLQMKALTYPRYGRSSSIWRPSRGRRSKVISLSSVISSLRFRKSISIGASA
jgi:hypothetical protein